MKTNIIKKTITLALGAIMCTALCVPSFAAVEKQPATLTVSSSASVYVAPDIAYVTFGVETREKSATKAQSLNSALMKKVIDAVKGQGIADKNIETSNMNMYPTYDYQKNDPQITGYSVSNTITVTIEKLDKTSAIVNAAMEAGANTLQGINFSIKDNEEAYQNALKLAVQKGTKRAQVLASASNMQLDGINTISDNGTTNYYPAARSANMNMVTETAQDAKIGDTIQPGKLEVSATVTMSYYVK